MSTAVCKGVSPAGFPRVSYELKNGKKFDYCMGCAKIIKNDSIESVRHKDVHTFYEGYFYCVACKMFPKIGSNRPDQDWRSFPKVCAPIGNDSKVISRHMSSNDLVHGHKGLSDKRTNWRFCLNCVQVSKTSTIDTCYKCLKPLLSHKQIVEKDCPSVWLGSMIEQFMFDGNNVMKLTHRLKKNKIKTTVGDKAEVPKFDIPSLHNEPLDPNDPVINDQPDPTASSVTRDETSIHFIDKPKVSQKRGGVKMPYNVDSEYTAVGELLTARQTQTRLGIHIENMGKEADIGPHCVIHDAYGPISCIIRITNAGTYRMSKDMFERVFTSPKYNGGVAYFQEISPETLDFLIKRNGPCLLGRKYVVIGGKFYDTTVYEEEADLGHLPDEVPMIIPSKVHLADEKDPLVTVLPGLAKRIIPLDDGTDLLQFWITNRPFPQGMYHDAMIMVGAINVKTWGYRPYCDSGMTRRVPKPKQLPSTVEVDMVNLKLKDIQDYKRSLGLKAEETVVIMGDEISSDDDDGKAVSGSLSLNLNDNEVMDIIAHAAGGGANPPYPLMRQPAKFDLFADTDWYRAGLDK